MPAQVREVLGREVLAGQLAQVGVDVGGLDDARLALVVHIAKEHLARQILAAQHHAREAPIVDLHRVLDAALAPEMKADVRAAHVDVLFAQRRQAEGAVGARVLLVADADQRDLEEPHHRRQHLLAREARAAELRVHRGADPRQRGGEGDHPLVLGLVAHLAEARVIAVLLAPPRVAPGRLEVPVGARADQTSVQAGGMARCRIRSTCSGSRSALPWRSRKRNPFP